MRSGGLAGVVQHLRKRYGPAAADGELLAQFAHDHDESAFAELVRRHAGLVLGVARRQLGDRHRAEDVAQAVFLVLARQARRLSRTPSLVNWLYTVAVRQARKARDAAARQDRVSGRRMPHAAAPDPLAEVSGRELVAVIDEELSRLPEAYRLPMLLCAVEGLSREEAARRLGWTVGMVKGRLERGRELLRRRLEARGLTVPAVLAAVMAVDTAMPRGLIAATSKAALAALTVPAAWVSLKTLAVAAVVLVAGVGSTAVLSLASRERERPEESQPPVAHAPGSPQPAAPAPRVDAEGAPLPPGVIARLGSSRLRHADMVVATAFAPDGKSLATRALDGVLIWDTATGKLVGRFDIRKDDTRPVLSYSPDGRELSYLDSGPGGGFRSLDPVTGRELRRFALEDQPFVMAMAISSTGRRFVVGRNDSSVHLYDASTGKETLKIAAPVMAYGLDFTPDDKLVAVADLSDTIRLYDTASGQPKIDLRLEGARFISVMISPDGRTLASADYGENGRGYRLHLWNLEMRQVRNQIQSKDSAMAIGTRFTPDSRMITTAGPASEPTLWDVATGREVRRFRGVAGALRPAFTPDGRTLAAGTNSGTVVLWDIESGQRLPHSADPMMTVRDLRYKDGGRRLLGMSSPAMSWDSATGRVLRRFPEVQSVYGYAVLSPDERLMAGVDHEGAIRLWDAATGRVVRELRGEKPFVFFAAQFSADGRRLFVADQDKVIWVWDVAEGKALHRLEGHLGWADKLVPSPDGRWLATASSDASARGDYAIRLWDLSTYREVKRFTPRRGSAFAIAFSPEGRRLAAVGGEPGRSNDRGEVQLWDIDSGKELRSFEGHTERVQSVAFSPNGRMLATGGLDTTVRLWEIESGGERERITGHTGAVQSVAFAPDGRTLAASSNDAPVYVWDLLGRLEPLAQSPTAAELGQAWDAFAGPDAKAAFQAIRRLVAAPGPTVAFLSERLTPAAPVDAPRVRDLIRQLDSPRFAERQQATTELDRLADRAAAELRAALKDAATLEVRLRLQQLLDRIDAGTPESLRSIRAVEALEYIATPAARAHLTALASGAAGATVTDAAAEALRRLDKPGNP